VEDLHRDLLRIGFNAGDDLGQVLAGGYALAAYELVDRPSRDIDFATATAIPLPHVVTRLVAAYEAAGFTADIVESTPRMARLLVHTSTATCEVDLLKEAIGPPTLLSVGPVLALGDAIGLKVRALHDRAAHRDFIDVLAANASFPWAELESLGARHTAGFSLEELADRLDAVVERDDRTFVAYGLASSISPISDAGRPSGQTTFVRALLVATCLPMPDRRLVGRVYRRAIADVQRRAAGTSASMPARVIVSAALTVAKLTTSPTRCRVASIPPPPRTTAAARAAAVTRRWAVQLLRGTGTRSSSCQP
jgi:hypothetical protein